MTDNIGKISKMLKQCYNMLNVEYTIYECKEFSDENKQRKTSDV